MAVISVGTFVPAPPTKIWPHLQEFGNIASWSSGLQSSQHIDGPETGEGAVRRCDFATKGYLNEEVVEWKEGESYAIRVLETDLPLRYGVGRFHLRPHDDGTIVTFAFSFGAAGAAKLATPMLKAQLKKNGKTILADLAEKAEAQ